MNTPAPSTPAGRTAARRPRPHPAKRARKITGAVSLAAMVLFTGGMVAATKKATVAGTAGSTTTAITRTNVASAYEGEADDDEGRVNRSVTAVAVPAVASSQANTSTHAS